MAEVSGTATNVNADQGVAYRPGDLVKASYKSGEYIGEIVEMTRSKAAVKVLAVLKHPAQGDLHHPYEVDGVMFMQRKALSYQEIALMPQYSCLPTTAKCRSTANLCWRRWKRRWRRPQACAVGVTIVRRAGEAEARILRMRDEDGY